jgi:large subunit ribosomal protein L3
MAWIITTKLEMTRVVKWERFIPVTLLQVPELKVVWFKTKEKDGYESIIIWVLENIEKSELKEGKITLNKSAFSEIKEFPLNEWEKEKFNIWDNITLDVFGEWDVKVSIEGFSKWKWFAWAMKRHNFHWWPWWHGSKFHRALGSIWTRKPRRTHKGKRMHWHLGNTKFTIKNVPVELINKEINVIGVRWWVPWGRHSVVSLTF